MIHDIRICSLLIIRLTGYEKRIGGYDLIWSDGPVYANSSDCGHSLGFEDGPKLNSFLGK